MRRLSFSTIGARPIEPRLRLTGYRAHDLYLGRLCGLWTLGILLAAPFLVLVRVDAAGLRYGARRPDPNERCRAAVYEDMSVGDDDYCGHVEHRRPRDPGHRARPKAQPVTEPTRATSGRVTTTTSASTDHRHEPRWLRWRQQTVALAGGLPPRWTASFAAGVPLRIVAVVRSTLDRVIRLLRLLPRGGRGLAAALATLQLIRALIPTALALSIGRMVSALFEAQTTTQQVVAAVLVAGLFLVDQIVWLLIVPVRTLVAKRIDGYLRARVRAIAGISGLDVLESEQFQDRAARAVDAGRSGWDRERSAGNATVGQLELTFRLLSALIAMVLLATFSVPIAVGLLALALTLRALVRRRWMVTIGKLDAETAAHRYEYYLIEQAVYGAHQEVRLFGLSDWFAGRFRAAVCRAYGPVWRDMLQTARQSWLPFGFFLLGYTTVLIFPAVATLRGQLDAGQLATYLFAGFAVWAMNAMGMEAYDIEYGIGAVRAAEELEAAHGQAARPAVVAAVSSGPTVRFDNVVFAYPGAAPSSTGSASLSTQDRHSRSSGRTASARRPWSSCSPACTARSPAASPWTACRRMSSDRRCRCCSRTSCAIWPPCGTTSCGARPERPATKRSATRCAWPGPARSGPTPGRRPTWIRCCGGRAPAVPTSPVGSGSGWRWRECCTRSPPGGGCSCSTNPRPADRIVLLRGGRVAEDGTHDELLALGGQYAHFFTTQAAAFADRPSHVEQS